jgi:anti-sigma regulatory factor (Ser/Thr protein kinase)
MPSDGTSTVPAHQAWKLPNDASTIPFVRHRVIDELRANGWDTTRIDEAALLTTELTTNAVEHTEGDYVVTLDLTDDRLRIEVQDQSAALPVLNSAPPSDDLHGRGMLFLDLIARDWGWRTQPPGKSVWFELELETDGASPSGGGQ